MDWVSVNVVAAGKIIFYSSKRCFYRCGYLNLAPSPLLQDSYTKYQVVYCALMGKPVQKAMV